jgi:hypothetical protein
MTVVWDVAQGSRTCVTLLWHFMSGFIHVHPVGVIAAAWLENTLHAFPTSVDIHWTVLEAWVPDVHPRATAYVLVHLHIRQ